MVVYHPNFLSNSVSILWYAGPESKAVPFWSILPPPPPNETYRGCCGWSGCIIISTYLQRHLSTYVLSYQAYCPKREVQRWIHRHTLPQHIHPLIVTNPPTFAYKSLAKCGTAYVLGLCVRVIDSLASVTQTHQPVGHTHIHTNRHQPIWYTKTHIQYVWVWIHVYIIHMHSHSNIHSVDAYTPVRYTHTNIQCNTHTHKHMHTQT